jgi:hypothetical protein
MVGILYSQANSNFLNTLSDGPCTSKKVFVLDGNANQRKHREKQLLSFQGLKISIRNHSDTWELSVRIYA